MTPLSLAIADDHVLFRKGLVALLHTIKGISVLFEADNGQQLLDGLATHRPDLVILDVEMPVLDGVQTARHLRQQHPDVKILVISMHDDDDLILNLIEEGAHGYLLKNADPAEVQKALEELVELGFYYSSRVTTVLREATLRKKRAKEHQGEALNNKELEVLALLLEEHTNAEIAHKLSISVRTVEGRRQRIMEKTGTHNVAGMLRYALAHKLLPKSRGYTK